VLGEAVAFCERRGITEMVLQIRSGIPTALADLGLTEQALAEAGPLADQIEAGGDMSYVEPRALLLWLLAERGAPEEAPTPDALVTAARSIGLPGFITTAFAAAARILLAQGDDEQARALLQELDELAAPIVGAFDERELLPSVVRVALAVNQGAVAERLTAAVKPVTPSRANALISAQAQLAEAAGDRGEATSMYADAAERWREFGNVPELAYALLGQGRCLAALEKPEAAEPLREAKELFTSMGYRPALAETDALLAGTAAAAS
jgi:tetratricopeptide (TPR) repeat protein